MTQRSSPTKPKKSRRPSPEPTDDHRNSGSDSSTGSPQVVESANEKEPDNPLPTSIVLLINLVIIIAVTVFLKNVDTLPCVTPQGNALSVVSASLLVFHFIWPFVYPILWKLKDAVVEFPVIIKMPLSLLIALLNSLHPSRLKSLRLVFPLLVLGAVVAWNLTPYSPFRTRGEPFAIQGFSVEHSNPPLLEQLAPGTTLSMRAGEKVILAVMLIGNAQVSCFWSTAREGDNARQGCSIDYTALSPGDSDILTVFVQPACEFRQEPASLFVTVQP
jgi:hypothetical protein